MKLALITILALGALSTASFAADKDCAYEKCLGGNPGALFTDTSMTDPRIQEAPASMPYSPCHITWGGTPGSLMQRGQRAGCHGFHPGAKESDYSDGYAN